MSEIEQGGGCVVPPHIAEKMLKQLGAGMIMVQACYMWTDERLEYRFTEYTFEDGKIQVPGDGRRPRWCMPGRSDDLTDAEIEQYGL